MRVELIAMAGPGMTGTSRYVADLSSSLRAAGVDLHLTHPTRAPIPRVVSQGFKSIGWDLQTFFRSYPLRADLARADFYHVVGQTLATLLQFKRFPAPVAVTVLDIIPWLVRRNPALNSLRHPVDRFFYRLALSGLKRADAIIAISEYTKRTLVETVGLPRERIHVVYPAVDLDRFRPLTVADAFRARYGLSSECVYLLFVGSDDPRKNLATLLRALGLLRQTAPTVRLLKVGAPHFVEERQRLLGLAAELGLQDHVLFFDHVSDEDLPFFYNAASVLVMPSLYEGFGLPVLEAMACGTPVICANATSLPEITGGGAALFEPTDAVQLAQVLGTVLGNRELRHSMIQSGLNWAQGFMFRRQASETIAVYSGVSAAGRSRPVRLYRPKTRR